MKKSKVRTYTDYYTDTQTIPSKSTAKTLAKKKSLPLSKAKTLPDDAGSLPLLKHI